MATLEVDCRFLTLIFRGPLVFSLQLYENSPELKEKGAFYQKCAVENKG